MNVPPVCEACYLEDPKVMRREFRVWIAPGAELHRHANLCEKCANALDSAAVDWIQDGAR